MRGTNGAAPLSGEAASPETASTQALLLENALLMRELGRAQRRCTRWHDEAAQRQELLEAQLICSRAECIIKATQLAVLREALDAVRQRSANDERAAPLHDRRVLCVGGRARQMPLYRALVEERGGRFAEAGGADEASLGQLRAALAEADIVVLQPRYVCQGACRLVETHCARAGIRFLQLDKCCLPGFADSLDLAATPN